MTAVALAAGAVALGACWRAAGDARQASAIARRLLGGVVGAVPGGRPASLPAGVAGAAVVVVVVLRIGTVAAVLAVAVAAVGRAAARQVRGRAAAARAGDELADVVEAVARGLRAGLPPVAAIRAAAASSATLGDLGAVAIRAEHGVPLVDALDRWVAARELDGTELVAAAFAVTSSAGGDQARALLAVADTLRERRAVRRELRALSSQARLSAAVVAAAPVGFAAFAATIDPTTAGILLGTPLGVLCVVAGVALDLAGWRWMERITRSVA